MLHEKGFVWCQCRGIIFVDTFFMFIWNFSMLRVNNVMALKSFLVENKASHSQSEYHYCWWPGDARYQGISIHGIDLTIPIYSSFSTRRVKILMSGQNGWHFADNIFKYTSMNEYVWGFVKNVNETCSSNPIDKSTLVQVMALHWKGDKPLPIMK